jgi:hypothetical protein
MEFPRSARFIYETIACDALRILVVKTTGHAMPTELQDCVYSALLALRGIELTYPTKLDTWKPFNVKLLWPSGRAGLSRKCYPIPLNGFGTLCKSAHYRVAEDYTQ